MNEHEWQYGPNGSDNDPDTLLIIVAVLTLVLFGAVSCIKLNQPPDDGSYRSQSVEVGALE